MKLPRLRTHIKRERYIVVEGSGEFPSDMPRYEQCWRITTKIVQRWPHTTRILVA